MAGVKIVTDSGASLPEEIVKKYDIGVVPLSVQFGTKTYREGVDLSIEEFYRKLEGPVHPTTSQPAPGDFVEVYKNVAQKARSIISIHITSKASGTYQVAELGAEFARSTIPGVDIEVVDSLSASIGQGFLVMAAAEAAEQNKTKEEILRRVHDLRPKIRLLGAIRTLKYLRKSGRIHRGQALIGTLLSIKPLITIKDGVVEVIERARTFPAALDRIMELTKESAGDAWVRLAVGHSNARDEAMKFCNELKRNLRCREAIVNEIGACLAAHGGPGIIGVAWHEV